VLELLADYGVEDVEMIIALAYHRRLTEAEVERMVGKNIFDKYWPDRLYHHDAEDAAAMVEIGTTPEGDVVEINRAAVEADLVIYVNINLVPMDGGHKSIGTGLCGAKTLAAHHNPYVLR
jgi:nickel-dependent lactate racemase